MIPAGAALCGCSTTLKTRAPEGVDLSGEWQIDLALSDFPQEAVPVPNAADTAGTSGGTSGGQTGGRGRHRSMGGGAQPGNGLSNPDRTGSPEHHFAMPPHLSISQSASGLKVDITMPDGKHLINNYTAGEKSTVSTTRGTADRTLGWDGEDFLIRTKVGDKGPQSDVRYILDNDGTLSVTSTITNSGIYNFQYTLEYDHVTPEGRP